VRETARRWRTPRLGLLYHHDPAPLTVPSYYTRACVLADPPLISIATPSYNQAAYLGRTMASVLGQDYPRIEYVVQDAESSDETREVLEGWHDDRLSWFCEPDRGQADGINRGLRRTRGEIMAYLNSDDLLLPGALTAVGRFFAENPKVDAVYGHRVLIDENDDRIGSWIVPRHDDEALRWADYVPQETLFWRRSLWERVGGRIDDSFAYALDWDLLLRFLEVGARIERVPRFLGAFRVHAAQKTTANHDVGEREVALLRERSFGRPVTHDEVMEHLSRYLRRHVVAHGVQRARDALHPARMAVAPYFAEHARQARPSINGRQPA
jgi:glycosyltransferase involved in cell wall biosynthesis